MLLGLMAVLGIARPAAAAPRAFGLHVVWLEDAAGDRDQVDRFYPCLLGGSNYLEFWDGDVAIVYRGSFVVPVPAALPLDATAAFLAEQIDAQRVPPPMHGETPIYLVHGNGAIAEGACGRFTPATIAGAAGGLAQIHVSPPCWPGTSTLRNVTQTGTHELAEIIDTLLGYGGCAADAACAGSAACEGACDNLVGLACPGAPTQTPTGCGQQVLDGFVVQSLGRAGRDDANCLRCFTCDFRIGPPGAPAPTPPRRSEGCGASSHAEAVLALPLFRRRRRMG